MWQGRKIILHKGYETVYMPEHPYAWAGCGLVYVHRLVMESHLGRYLNPAEKVHHKGEDKRNNAIDNLDLTTDAEHATTHWSLRKPGEVQRLGVRPCRECAALFQPDKAIRAYCSVPCMRQARGARVPAPDVLAEMLSAMPATAVGAFFGVTSTAVKKWCVRYGITPPGRGHWAKARALPGV